MKVLHKEIKKCEDCPAHALFAIADVDRRWCTITDEDMPSCRYYVDFPSFCPLPNLGAGHDVEEFYKDKPDKE